MVLQPASGARDLNPKQVEVNQLLTKELSSVYRLWGYEEVAPPRVERIETLTAGGAISRKDIVQLVADEPLGLRPEMTASIARAACTRLSNQKRPLRLWTAGTVFETKESVDSSLLIEENLKCGVELIGVKGINGEMELLSLLLKVLEKLEINEKYVPTLLIGHTSLLELVLSLVDESSRNIVKSYLLNFDRVKLEEMKISRDLFTKLKNSLELRGDGIQVLNTLKDNFGQYKDYRNLSRLFNLLTQKSENSSLKIQLDPTFQPHYELYKGIVFQLICKGDQAPIVIASGGRYDEIIEGFGFEGNESGGIGFSFAIDKIRELGIQKKSNVEPEEKILIAYGNECSLEKALDKQDLFHREGIRAQLELEPCESLEVANQLLKKRKCNKVEWIAK